MKTLEVVATLASRTRDGRCLTPESAVDDDEKTGDASRRATGGAFEPSWKTRFIGTFLVFFSFALGALVTRYSVSYTHLTLPTIYSV